MQNIIPHYTLIIQKNSIQEAEQDPQKNPLIIDEANPSNHATYGSLYSRSISKKEKKLRDLPTQSKTKQFLDKLKNLASTLDNQFFKNQKSNEEVQSVQNNLLEFIKVITYARNVEDKNILLTTVLKWIDVEKYKTIISPYCKQTSKHIHDANSIDNHLALLFPQIIEDFFGITGFIENPNSIIINQPYFDETIISKREALRKVEANIALENTHLAKDILGFLNNISNISDESIIM